MHLSNIDIVKILCKAIIVRREQEIHNSFRYQKLHNNLTSKELHMKKKLRKQWFQFASGDPVARWGGDRPPIFFFSRDFVANLKKKKLNLSPVAPHRATGVYFWNFPKPTYIFEILIFLNIKKKKPPQTEAVGRIHMVKLAHPKLVSPHLQFYGIY